MVNQFRQEEGNTTKLQHKDFMKSIRKEVEALENVGIKDERNFALGSYIDKQGQERPCYQLTKSATMQMLNKESPVIRYKTQLYIEAYWK
ncbi:Rha family transcriptional regulator [Intestinibacter sp.]